jgi:hypothetical protein
MPMSAGSRASLVVAMAIAAAVAWIVASQTGPASAVDLLDGLGQAERRPFGGSFDVGPVTINGESIRAVAPPGASRITWEARLPDRAVLDVAIALKPEAWSVEGDGVLFRVGIADERNYEEHVNRVVNPFGRPDDRRWIHLVVDLAQYSGFRWSLFFHPRRMLWRIILNTNAGIPGSTDQRGDMPLWGEPRLLENVGR